jgi:GT2 family glycosyltransferase
MTDSRPTLAVIIVSSNHGRWLTGCVSSVRSHAGDIDLEIVVVDSGSTDDSAGIAESLGTRVLRSPNHGFAYANNRGLEVVSAEWVLFLNPDTEVIRGSLRELVGAAASHPKLGIAGVPQLLTDGSLDWTIRRSPSPARWMVEALSAEALPGWSGERVLDAEPYRREHPIDWMSGSFMLARRATLTQIGGMDEQFFLYSEEPDLCLRAKNAGWEVWHLPVLTIVHHGGNERSDPRLTAQLIHSRRLYLRKHGSPAERALGYLALALGQALRSVFGSAQTRKCSRVALGTLLGLRSPPFEALTAPSRRL